MPAAGLSSGRPQDGLLQTPTRRKRRTWPAAAPSEAGKLSAPLTCRRPGHFPHSSEEPKFPPAAAVTWGATGNRHGGAAAGGSGKNRGEQKFPPDPLKLLDKAPLSKPAAAPVSLMATLRRLR